MSDTSKKNWEAIMNEERTEAQDKLFDTMTLDEAMAASEVSEVDFAEATESAASETAGDQTQKWSYDTLAKNYRETAARAEDYYEKLLRLQAQMDNLQRRTENQIVDARKFGTEQLLKALLPVLDSIDSGLGACDPNDDSIKQFRDGLELTHKLFADVLIKHAVQAVEPAAGESFDPNFHQAMSLQPHAELPANTVISVMQKGYTLNGRLLRPALVMVSSGAA